ncbi:hypothetical protein [Niastella populi]|uniref:Uncharacterized protein n=1 Tax=Niastella populi TaxID=550983 RepID=A0A1V9FZ75_9BACT|nr:hypothetical protein [Niastella populi]OQP63632.1 hypothetical protein A4R26_16810 [Niastella populi]
MKVLLFLLALPVMASKCSKTKESDTQLKGRVIRVSCASFVVQVLNDDKIGEDGWKDMSNNNATYDNVFNANNACKIPAGIKAGTTIRFNVSSPAQNDCVTCMMFDGPPNVKYDITDVSIVEK